MHTTYPRGQFVRVLHALINLNWLQGLRFGQRIGKERPTSALVPRTERTTNGGRHAYVSEQQANNAST